MGETTTDDLGARATAASRRMVRTMLLAVVLTLLAATAVVTMTDGARAAGPVVTERTVLRPVTATGHAAAGYRVVADHRPAVTCWSRSPVAVDRGIAWCGSTADYTVACWRSHTRTRVLCLSDPFGHTLHSIRFTGSFPRTVTPTRPSPQALRLDDGVRYLVRAGGAWGQPADHPTWVGWYFQRTTFTHDVYGPSSGDGIDRTHGLWSVTVYGSTTKPGVPHAVVRAYYVGTAR